PQVNVLHPSNPEVLGEDEVTPPIDIEELPLAEPIWKTRNASKPDSNHLNMIPFPLHPMKFLEDFAHIPTVFHRMSSYQLHYECFFWTLPKGKLWNKLPFPGGSQVRNSRGVSRKRYGGLQSSIGLSISTYSIVE
ncbi:hypothetical protein HK096_006867, partial [Nowakowskiella sp. JEL0078]